MARKKKDQDVIDAEIIEDQRQAIQTFQENKALEIIKESGSVKDIYTGLKNKDLYAVKRGFLSLLSKTPFVGKSAVKSTSPVDLLNADISETTDARVVVGRRIVNLKRGIQDTDGNIRHYRWLIRRAETLLPIYVALGEDGATPTGLIPDIEQTISNLETHLLSEGYDPTDPDFTKKLTPEIAERFHEKNVLSDKLSIYRKRAARHRARITHFTYGIEDLAVNKRQMQANLITAEEQESELGVRIKTSTMNARSIARTAKLQESMYDAYMAEQRMIQTSNAVTFIIAERTRQLIGVIEQNNKPTIDRRLLAYSDRTAAALTERVTQLQLEGPKIELLLEPAYKVLGLLPTSTSTQIEDRYRELAAEYHPDNKETGDAEKFKKITQAKAQLIPDISGVYDKFNYIPSAADKKQLISGDGASERKALPPKSS